MRWIWQRLVCLVEASHSPERAFDHRVSGASWTVPFMVFAFMFLAISRIQAPMQFEWAEARLEAAGAPAERAAESVERMRSANLLGIVIVPLLLLVRWITFALLIWLVAGLWSAPLELDAAIGVVAFSYTPILVRDAAACTVLLLRGSAARTGPGGLDVALGLNLLFPGAGMPWASALGNINLFEIWYLALLATGVAAATGGGRKRGWMIVLPVWAFVLLFQLAFLALTLPLTNRYF